MAEARTERDILRKAHAVLTRVYADLYELLGEIVPPATKPLHADRDTPTGPLSQGDHCHIHCGQTSIRRC